MEFYHQFIKNYASIAFSLTKLLKKDSFVWTTYAQVAFESLKLAMTTALVLKLVRDGSERKKREWRRKQ